MSQEQTGYPTALVAREAAPNAVASILPPPLGLRLQGRQKHKLGDLFGLTNFGVNIVRLAPGSMSSFRHSHARQDEFIYVLEGRPTLHTNDGERELAPGMCAGFKAGSGNAHNLSNRTDADVWYLEIGDRTPGDEVSYPDEDLKGVFRDGRWEFTHKDGRPY